MLKTFSALALTVALLAGAARAGETLVVVQKGDDSVGLYDADSGSLLARVGVGTKPHEVALSDDGRLAYVTNYGVDRYTETIEGGNSVSIVDLAARRVVGTVDLGRYHRPHGIALGRSGRLYVTCDFPPSLVVIEPRERRVERVVEVGQALPHMVAVTPDERKAYTANSGAGTVSAVAVAEGKVAAQIDIGGVPMGFALTGDGRRLFAANRTGDAIVVIDTARDAVVGRLPIAGSPTRLQLLPGDARLIAAVTDANAVAVVDVDPLREVRRFSVGRHDEGLGLDPSGRFGYVAAQDDDKVVKFSLTDWKVVLDVKTARRPGSVGVQSR
jgi:YVTN family beta-propeller protein